MYVCMYCRTYLWFDEKGKKTRVAAPQYIDYVMTFTQKTISDESIFPTKYGKLLSKLLYITSILCKRMFLTVLFITNIYNRMFLTVLYITFINVCF